MKGAGIVGASSGIGRALAVTLPLEGYRVGVVVRRTDLLTQLQAELSGRCVISTVDVSQPELVYITRRWRLIAWLMEVVPDALYSKL